MKLKEHLNVIENECNRLQHESRDIDSLNKANATLIQKLKDDLRSKDVEIGELKKKLDRFSEAVKKAE